MRVKLINALSLPHPNNKNRSIVHRGGTVLDLDDEIAQRALDLGAAELPEREDQGSSGDPVEDNGDGDPVALPPRPSNGATRDAWRAYLVELGRVTTPPLEPLAVPDDITRDRMIQLGDARVREWDELDEED
jgi:hypothetical protein